MKIKENGILTNWGVVIFILAMGIFTIIIGILVGENETYRIIKSNTDNIKVLQEQVSQNNQLIKMHLEQIK